MFQPRSLLLSTRCSQCLQHLARRSYAARTSTRLAERETAQSSSSSATTADNATSIGLRPATSASASETILRTYKPRTPSVRHLKRPINDHLWKGKPYRRLTFPKVGQAKGGRNNSGRITVRHRGGGHRRRIRIVDFERKATGKHIVDRIEYDPNRSAHIALVTRQKTDEKSYIIAAEGMRAGDVIESFRSGLPRELVREMGGMMDPGMLAAKTALRGNCLPIRMIPVGTQIYNVGSTVGKGAVFCRSAGTYAVIISKQETKHKVKEVVVRLQSGELRKVSPEACATVGVASNPNYHFGQLGKAGRSRWLNIRPTVRGVAMNAVDHPHGGGRGKSKGNVIPVSPWGTPAKSGYKTRRKSKKHVFLVKDRERNQGKRRSKKA